MLVLSRKANEVICIGKDIRVMVIEIRGDKVRLGVDCPKHIGVHRKEVWDAIVGQGGDPSVAGKDSSQ